MKSWVSITSECRRCRNLKDIREVCRGCEISICSFYKDKSQIEHFEPQFLDLLNEMPEVKTYDLSRTKLPVKFWKFRLVHTTFLSFILFMLISYTFFRDVVVSLILASILSFIAWLFFVGSNDDWLVKEY